MAYDKIVDSAALDAVFTNIGNAIRGKTGDTAAIAYDAMAAAIAAIDTGSGGASTMASGEFTVATDCKSVDVTHNLGVVPNFVVLVSLDSNAATSSTTALVSGVADSNLHYSTINAGGQIMCAIGIKHDMTSPDFPTLVSGVVACAATKTSIKLGCALPMFSLPAGKTYRWYAGVR